MLGHEARLFPRPPQNMQLNNSNDLSMMYPLKRLQQEVNTAAAGTAAGMRLDMNRNSLSFDRQLYENFGKFCQEQHNVKTHMRNNTRNHMNYMPYPTLPFSNLYYRQMTGLDLNTGVQGFPTQQQQQQQASVASAAVNQRNNMRATGGNWQLDQVSEYCAELLNRDKHYWTDEETTLMLELYEENRNYFNDSKTKKTKVWNVIANIINKRFNTNVNSEQCSQKYRNLKAEFLKVVDPNSADGGAKKFGRHFNQMKRLVEVEERKGSKVAHVSPQNAAPASLKPCISEANPITATFANLTTNTISPTNNSTVNTQPDLGPNKMADIAPPTSHDVIKSDVINAATQVFPTPDDENLTNILTSMQGHPNFTSMLTSSEPLTSPSNKNVATNFSTSSEILPETPTVENYPNLNNEQKSEPIKNSGDKSYSDELNVIFQDYFRMRNQSMDHLEHDQKANVVCLKRCLDIFQKIVDDDSFV